LKEFEKIIEIVNDSAIPSENVSASARNKNLNSRETPKK
jgi:hypothetical protein